MEISRDEIVSHFIEMGYDFGDVINATEDTLDTEVILQRLNAIPKENPKSQPVPSANLRPSASSDKTKPQASPDFSMPQGSPSFPIPQTGPGLSMPQGASGGFSLGGSGGGGLNFPDLVTSMLGRGGPMGDLDGLFSSFTGSNEFPFGEGNNMNGESQPMPRRPEKPKPVRKAKVLIVPKIQDQEQLTKFDFEAWLAQNGPKKPEKREIITPVIAGNTQPLAVLDFNKLNELPKGEGKLILPKPKKDSDSSDSSDSNLSDICSDDDEEIDNLENPPEEEPKEPEKPQKPLAERIRKKLIKAGVEEDKAEMCAQNCTSVEEAFKSLGLLPPLKKEPKPQKNAKGEGMFGPMGFDLGAGMSGSIFSSLSGDLFGDMGLGGLGGQKKKKIQKSAYEKKMKHFKILACVEPAMFSDYHFPNSMDLEYKAKSRFDESLEHLIKSLQCLREGACYLTIDLTKMTRGRMVVTGKSGSPYAYGIYMFDLMIPYNYPEFAPKLFMKTGLKALKISKNSKKMLVKEGDHEEYERKNVNWHPRIGVHGMVKLGILNTSTEKGEEKWNKEYSDISDIATQINSVIMDNNILSKREDAKEREKYMNLPGGHPHNRWARHEILYANVRFGIIDMIKNTPPGYEMIILLHFNLVHMKISKMLEKTIKHLTQEPLLPDKDYRSDNPEIYDYLVERTPKTVFNELLREFEKIVEEEKLDFKGNF